MSKISCSKCNNTYQYDSIKLSSNGAFIYLLEGKTVQTGLKCQVCKNNHQKERRKTKGNLDQHKYEKTIDGFLMRVYRNMNSRVSGVQSKKHYLYAGKYLIDKNLFYEWSKNNEDFNSLFNNWEKSGYEKKICPSIDRINPEKGYSIDNMRWITFSKNCSETRRNKSFHLQQLKSSCQPQEYESSDDKKP